MTTQLNDGYQTLVSFAADPTVLMYEKSVTPPELDGGGEIDITTMLNTAYRTQNPKALISVGDAAMTVAYDPAVYPEIVALLNINTLITLTFPDGDTVAWWGWLNKFTPGEHVEGEQPTADLEIKATNHNDSGVETGPVHTPA